MQDYAAPSVRRIIGFADVDLTDWEIHKKDGGTQWRATWRAQGRRTDVYADSMLDLLLNLREIAAGRPAD